MQGPVREKFVFNSLHPSTTEVTFKRKTPIYVRCTQIRIHESEKTVELVALPSGSDYALQLWQTEQEKDAVLAAKARAIFPFCTVLLAECRILEVRARQSSNTFAVLLQADEITRDYKKDRNREVIGGVNQEDDQ